VIRIAKIAVVLSVGAIMFLVAIGNIFDYSANFDVVQHVLAMDTVPETPLKWRAITSPWLHHAFYLFIIATEATAGALSLYGGFLLWRERAGDAQAFNAAKTAAIGGVALAFVLYVLGFMGVGGEWFLMWRSETYNLQEAAAHFISFLGPSLIFVSLTDVD
jgi:predicted small integral membrane protein